MLTGAIRKKEKGYKKSAPEGGRGARGGGGVMATRAPAVLINHLETMSVILALKLLTDQINKGYITLECPR